MADPRVVSGFKPYTKEIVYSIVANKSSGSHLWDIDGNEYIDALNGFGSNLLGYQHPVLKNAILEQVEKGYEIGPQHELAGEVSKLICEFTGFDRAALCNTGSEAVLGAMRIARTVTGRSLIVAFSGSYHGINDEVIIRGTKKLKSFPAAPGIMPEAVQNMLILDYGTEETLNIIRERANEIAAVLVEPVQSRRPEFQPVAFLKEVREITLKSETVLIFDEVITGFRAHQGGAQALFGIKADLGTYGKVIGGGLPIGAIAGKKQFMDALDGGFWQYGDASFPEAGVTYFAGTFVRHPLALAAGKASLEYMKAKGPEFQSGLNKNTAYLAGLLNDTIEELGLPLFAAHFGSLWKIKFKEEYPYSELLFTLMRYKGIHIWDGFPCFLTEAHTLDEIKQIAERFKESVSELMRVNLIPLNESPALTASERSGINPILQPPVPGARLGRDQLGNPAWFITDPENPKNIFRLSQTVKMIDRTKNIIYKQVDFDPFLGGEIIRTAPSTEPQIEIWTSCMLGGNDASRAYNESVSLRLTGSIDLSLLKETIKRIAERHEALRSAFSRDGATILIFDRVFAELTYTDLSGLSTNDQEEEIKNYVHRDALFLFDLLNGPLFKTGLQKISDQDYHFTLPGHHIICDGWSLGIILQDISKIYSALVRKTDPDLEEATLLTDFAYEQLDFSKSSERKTNEQFWLSQYEQDIPVLDIPTDHERPQLRTFKSNRLDFNISQELIHSLKETGRAEGSSLVITFLAAFEIFLHFLTGQKNIVVGLPASGQAVTGHYDLVGHCVNFLPLRSYPNKNYSFKEYLKIRKSAMLDAFDHQQITWGNLLKNLKIARDPSRIPLAPVVFNVDMGLDDGVSFENLEYKLISNPRAFESFELFINASGSENYFVLEWSYNTQLFEQQTIQQMMAGFEQILKFITTHPDQKLKELIQQDSENFLSAPIFKRSIAVTKIKTTDFSEELLP
ncbi:aminotransferase class III-fold pyridoxal phosphate-dependent enzyme [Pedobacter sp. NJ-S-72]